MPKSLLAILLALLASLVQAAPLPSPLPSLLGSLKAQGEKGLVMVYDDGSANAEITTDWLHGGAMRYALRGYQVVALLRNGARWVPEQIQGCDGDDPCAAEALRRMSAAQLLQLRDSARLHGAVVLVYATAGTTPIGMADGFDHEHAALVFAHALRAATPHEPIIGLVGGDFSTRTTRTTRNLAHP